VKNWFYLDESIKTFGKIEQGVGQIRFCPTRLIQPLMGKLSA
jgi:hypothetical protein